METSSTLTIIKGQEFKVVDKHFIGEDDIFLDQYKQAAEMLNTIVNESKESAENHFLNEYENNIIAFCGERGEGKSSAMLTFINSLYEDYWEDEEEAEDNKKENTDREAKRCNLFKNYRNLDKNILLNRLLWILHSLMRYTTFLILFWPNFTGIF